MMRALVLERRGRHAIVLLPGGEIRRVPARSALAGDEVLVGGARGQVGVRRFGYAAATLGLLLALLPAELPFAQAKVAAFVTVDINPSVELGVSAGGTVLTSHALDQDGRQVLASARVRGESLAAAVGSLMRIAAADGFIPPGTPAAVIVAGYDAGGATALPTSVQAQLRLARSTVTAFLHGHGLHGVVSAMIVPPVLVRAASRAHVSAGVYAVWSALHRAGVAVPVAELRGRHLAAAMAQIAGTRPGQAVLPLLTGKTTHPATPAASKGISKTSAVAPVTHHPSSPAGGVTSSHGQGKGEAGASSPATTQMQVQIVTPGGTLQLQVGGDGQEGGGNLTTPPAGSGSQGSQGGQVPSGPPGGSSPVGSGSQGSQGGQVPSGPPGESPPASSGSQGSQGGQVPSGPPDGSSQGGAGQQGQPGDGGHGFGHGKWGDGHGRHHHGDAG